MGDCCRKVINLGTAQDTFLNPVKNKSQNRDKLNQFTLLLPYYFVKILTTNSSGDRPEGVWQWYQYYTGSPYKPIFILMPQTGKQDFLTS